MTRRFALWLAGAALASRPALGETLPKLAIIAHKSNRMDTLAASKLRLIFLKKVSRWPWGAKIRPVNLDRRDPLRRAFSEQMLRQSPGELDAYWIEQKVTRNLSRPHAERDYRRVLAMVASSPGAIAYVPKNMVDDRVKVIEAE